MMNTPSMYSVDQLLKARQNGVPDYVVVPMLQKAMAQKQAMAQQQALQQGAPKPPVAQQILDAAHNDVMQEHMARQVEEQPEARGIDSLPSGIDEGDYAGGGIIAFAEGGGINDYPAYDASPYTGQYTDEEKNPEVLTEQFKKRMGEDPGVAKQEARIGEREASLKSEGDKAPWMALMQAGLATMAGTSPNAFANIGAGATKGLESYGESKKNLSARADKLDDLRSKIEESQRAEALAAVKYGSESAERRRLSDHTDKLKGAEAQLKYNEDVAKHGIEKEKLGVEKQKAADDASYHQGYLGYLKSKEGANGEKPMTGRQIVSSLKEEQATISTLLKNAKEDGDEGAVKHYSNQLISKTNEINTTLKRFAKEGLAVGNPIELYTPPPPDPKDDRHFWEKWSDTTPQPKKTAVGNPKIDALVNKYSQ
jgi:hypothetical protein